MKDHTQVSAERKILVYCDKNNIKAMCQGANGLKESSTPPIIGRLATTIIDIKGSYSGFSGEKDINIFR